MPSRLIQVLVRHHYLLPQYAIYPYSQFLPLFVGANKMDMLVKGYCTARNRVPRPIRLFRTEKHFTVIDFKDSFAVYRSFSKHITFATS